LVNAYAVIFGIAAGTSAAFVILGAILKWVLKWPWLDEALHKINMKSLLKGKKRNYRLNGILLLCGGFLDVIPYSLLYYVADLPILACTCMIFGAIIKFIGLINLYKGTTNAGFQVKIALAYMLGIWVFGGQIVYYTVLIFTHVS
jgi:hypothetical protein